MNLKLLKKAGIKAVRDLRENKLRSGLTFMINTSELPSNQCYFEYPDGSVKIVTLCREICDFKILKELNAQEIKAFRKKYKLPEIKI